MWLSHAFMQQKYLAQSGRYTWTAVDIFNTSRVFTNEPILEEEMKLQCINKCQALHNLITLKKINMNLQFFL